MESFGISWISLTIIISTLPIIYWYLTRNFRYWKKLGVSGPKPWPMVGNLLSQMIEPLPVVEMNWSKEFGKIYGIYELQKPILTVGEPELIKSILVKDFHLFTDRKPRSSLHEILKNHLFLSTGDQWKRLRSIMSPTFTSGKMKKMYPMIRQCLNEFLDHLEVSAQNKDNIDLKYMHSNFTMDVIATCAFATTTNTHKDPNNPFILNARKIFDFKMFKILAVHLLPNPIVKMLGIRSANDESANQFFLNLTRHILRQRKANPKANKQFNDFIQLLADAEKDREDLHDENDMNEAHYVNDGLEELEVEKKTLSINVVNKQLTEEEIMAQGWLFFIAGYETTATTLTFCSYELAVNPEVQERLYDEVQSAVDSDGEISYETLARLSYLDAVISEALRLYTPVMRLDRTVSADYKLGNTGIQLFKGQVIEIPVYAMHHSEDFYPNPNRFIPERFLPENRHKIQPYSYIPFGAGPRNCIGMRFALMEAKLCLTQIVRRLRFFRSEQTAVPLVFKKITQDSVCAAESVVVGIEKR